MKKLLKCKKGLTLIELIVGIVMFSIIAIAISTALAPTLFSYMRANDFAEYNALLDNIANQMINDLSQSTDKPVFDDTAGAGGWAIDNSGRLTITTNIRVITYSLRQADVRVIDNIGGVLQKEGINTDGDLEFFDVFSEDFYKRKSLSFMLEDVPGTVPAYTLTLRLRENSNLGNIFEISREYAVRPLMLEQLDD